MNNVFKSNLTLDHEMVENYLKDLGKVYGLNVTYVNYHMYKIDFANVSKFVMQVVFNGLRVEISYDDEMQNPNFTWELNLCLANSDINEARENLKNNLELINKFELYIKSVHDAMTTVDLAH